MRSVYLAFVILFCMHICNGQDDAARRLIFIGEPAGDVKDDNELLGAANALKAADSNTLFVFLGNYRGARDNESDILRSRAAFVMSTAAKAIFIPGNKDWNDGKLDGYKTALAEADYIRSLNNSRISYYPDKGCPGPVNVPLGSNTRLVIMNTQWWLHEYEQAGMESDCPTKNRQQVLDELTDIVEGEREKLLVFIGHHPFEGTGLRSGYFGLRQHIFPLTDIPGMQHFYLPLPVAGSLYPLARNVFATRQDMIHKSYDDMSSSIDEILNRHPYAIRVAGHEHHLELYKRKNNYYITSGGGKKATRVAKTKNTVFAAPAHGFAVLEISASGKVGTSFYGLKNGNAVKLFDSELLNFSRLPPIAKDTARMPMTGLDSVTASVNKNFDKAGGLKRFLAGSNYRKEWAAPVKLKVFKLKEEKGGMKITGQGGGNMTKTIRVEDANGRRWSLRSVNKDPERLVPENFRHTLAHDVAEDMISAAHPYAPLVAARLTRAIGLVQAEEAYYFLPNDPALGYYRPAFANTVVMLEEREPSRYGEDTKSTWEVVNGHLEHNNTPVDQRTYLKGRMLDVIIADYDRHYEQWKWGTHDSAGKKKYYAIPKDRDQALYYSDGLGLKLFTINRMTYLRGLQHRITNIKSLGYVGRDADAFFLNELAKKDWQQALSEMDRQLSDSVIADAVRQLPSPVYALHGVEIESKLRDRKNQISRKGMEYYKFLAARVAVVGSNEDEKFQVSGGDSGVLVQVYKKDNSNGTGSLTYSRYFDPADTREVRLYGLNGNDYFDIDESVESRIKFRIVGGPGTDSFDLKGRVRNFIYDNAREPNVLLNTRRTINMISRRADANSYFFREENHNSHRFPTFSAAYNPEDLVLVGFGLTIKKRGFRNEGYFTVHRVSTLISVANQAYQLSYNGEMIDVYRHYDLVLKASFINPTLNNFFGYGNGSTYDHDKPLKFYAVRYSWLTADVLARKRFFRNKAGIAIGPAFYYYWNSKDRSSGRILENPEAVGLQSDRVFSATPYLGGRMIAGFNSIDNMLLPTRGVEWVTEFSVMKSLSEAQQPLPKLRSDISIYAPFSKSRKLVLAIHAGGGHLFSDRFEYFQAFTLGSENYLRGYQKNRFTGSSMAYGSLELRARLFDLQSHIVPGEFGIVGISDNGRVWMKNEQASHWHHAFGGGVYFTPFHSALLSVIVATSDEGPLLNMGVGSKLNITF